MSDMQIKEAKREVLLDTYREMLGEREIELFKKRMEEEAYLFLKSGEREKAELSFATSLDLEHVSYLNPNPFLSALIETWINVDLSEKGDKRGKDSRLIVVP